jgi:hypothetical protein
MLIMAEQAEGYLLSNQSMQAVRFLMTEQTDTSRFENAELKTFLRAAHIRMGVISGRTDKQPRSETIHAEEHEPGQKFSPPIIIYSISKASPSPFLRNFQQELLHQLFAGGLAGNESSIKSLCPTVKNHGQYEMQNQICQKTIRKMLYRYPTSRIVLILIDQDTSFPIEDGPRDDRIGFEFYNIPCYLVFSHSAELKAETCWIEIHVTAPSVNAGHSVAILLGYFLGEDLR